MTKHSKRTSGEKGTALIVGTASMVLLVPMIGLAVDVGFLYSVKAHLQATVDGASLAAARSLSLGADTASQKVSAQQNANNWFYANLPTGYWSTTNPDMAPDDAHVTVQDDPNNAHLRLVNITAAIDVPTFFMHWFGRNATHVVAQGFASRRDVVAMLVLDRSGSMCTNSGSSTPCDTTNVACGGLVNAAKLFNEQFATGRDKIGAVSFATATYLHSVPTDTFKTALGHGSVAGGELDTIVCDGHTSSAQAISLAYNEIYKTYEPGALNLIVFETDGLPNTVAVNLWDGTPSGFAITPGSPCTDATGKTKSLGGFQAGAASRPYWQGNAGTPTWVTTTLANGSAGNPFYGASETGPAFYTSSIPAGMIAGIGGNDPPSATVNLLFKSFTTVKTNTYNESGNSNVYLTGTASGCTLQGNHTTTSDLAWLPTTDVYGNALTNTHSYKPVAMTGTHVTLNMGNIRNAAYDSVDDAAYRFRTNATMPVYFFGVGFNTPDDVLMQRVTNDPAWMNQGGCVSPGPCVYDSTQPAGTYVKATSPQALNAAFVALASQILRLSH